MAMSRRTLGMPRPEYLARVGEEVEPGGREPAPSRLRTLQRFINTFNHELPERDRLGTTEQAAAWLRRHDLMGEDEDLDEAGRVALVALREALRELALANLGGDLSRPAQRTLEVASRRAGLVLKMAPGRSSLEPAAPGVDGAAGRLLAQVHGALADGSWFRLKGCRQCGYAFYDRSRNRSGEWCAMSVCGNRVKNRSYRARRPAPA